jgi:hypothetical protein
MSKFKGGNMSRKTLIIKQTRQIVRIERKWPWSNVIITLEGREIGRFNSLKDLKEPQILKTPIGDISVELKPRLGFEAWHNGEILEGSVSDPTQSWRVGYQIAIGLGVFNMLIGLLAMTSKSAFLTAMGASPYSFVFGVVLLFLGRWSLQRRSSIALWLATFLFGADGMLGFLFLLSAHVSPNIGGVLVRASFVFGMAQGAMAAAKLDAEEEVVPENEPEFIYEKAKKRF